MDKLITLWQGMTTDQLAVSLLALAVVFLANSYRLLSYKYAQQDKLLLLLCHRVARDAVNIHRSGDYEIVNPLNNDVV